MKRILVVFVANCIVATCTVATLVTAAHGQSPWQGEWGHFNDPDATVGARLTISTCTNQTCKFNLSVRQSTMYGCGTSGSDDAPRLNLLSATDATVTMPAGAPSKSCTLTLHRDAAPPHITVATAGNCAYYCNTTPSFNATLPFRSTTLYTSPRSNACFLDNSPATTAICADTALGNLEQQWIDLYSKYPLTPDLQRNSSAYTYAETTDSAIHKLCDTASQPAKCLHDRYTADIATMQAHKSAVDDASTERGDPATGRALALKIAGRYRYSFPNADVQGDTYRSTDTLTITPVGSASIRFDIELNFYNGHTCSLNGGALFRKNGTFVFDDDPANKIDDEPLCRLAIIPAADGVRFKDLTGSCRMYCGARGTLDGAGFTFAQRLAARK